MPYPAGHRDNTRTRIVHAARRLFNRNGFENVSIDQIMAAAGLTRGSFYNYFDSTSDLYVEVLSCFFTDPNWKNTWEGVGIDVNAACVGPHIVRAYLSRQHFENVDDSCPMIALPRDIARGEQQAKRAFETVFDSMVRFLERGVHKPTSNTRATAQAIAALCVGGMVVARAMDQREVADDLRTARATRRTTNSFGSSRLYVARTMMRVSPCRCELRRSVRSEWSCATIVVSQKPNARHPTPL